MAETREALNTRKFDKIKLHSTQMQTMGKFRKQIEQVFGHYPDETPLMFAIEFRFPPKSPAKKGN